MSGFMRKAALVVGAVALVAATAGAAAPLLAPGMAGAAGIAGVSAATLTAIGTYGGLAAGVLTAISTATAPGMSSQGSQTSFTTNPQSGLPYAMGRTRMSGLRIYANTNTRPGYTKFNDLLWFGALLSIGGTIGGIEKFTADNEIVTFDASGNAIGDYHDYQGQKIHLGGQQTSALALTLGGGSAPGWSSAHKLSGITHAMWCLRYNKQGEMYGAGAPEPAWIGNWVKVYDPRLDSTYPGGSGSCRALVESTYVWSDNPGLHALTWALGRWQNGKRTCGIGAPVANIRVAEFVECANVCEANGWKVGGVEWTTDSKWDTLKRILQSGGAIPTQTGAMVGCLVSTPRTAIATIESRHLLDSLSIAATKSRRDRFNSVIPRYVDEDSDWSVISGTAITVSDYVTADKGQRTKEIDYPLVQVFSGDEATQPGQLAAYDIVNSREAGPINFTTGPEWIGLKTGDVILLNVPEEGLVNQPVLITRRAPDPSTGKVSFSAQTETYAKHAYALGQSTTPPAPFSLSAPDLKPPAPAAANWAAAGTVTGEGLPAIVVTGNSEMPSADAVLIDYKLPADATWTRSAILSANEPVQHVITPLQSETAYQVRVGYRVEQIDGDFTILAAVTTGAGIISDISGTIGQQQDQLEQLDQDTAAAQANIAAAQAQIAAIESSVTADFSAVNGQIGNLTSQVGTVSGNLSTLTSQVGTVSSDVMGLTNRITSAEGQISTTASTVSTQGSLIQQNILAISNVEGSLASLTTQVNAGTNPNLLPNGTGENGLAFWSSGHGVWGTIGESIWGQYFYVLPSGSVGDRFYHLVSHKVAYTGAAAVTFTCGVDFNATGNCDAGLRLRFLSADGSVLKEAFGPRIYNQAGFHNDAASRATLKTTDTAPVGTTHVDATVIFFTPDGVTLNGGAFRQAKLEFGTVATPYSADASIRQTFLAISTTDQSVAQLTTTVSANTASIIQQSTAISTLQGTTASLSSSVSTHDGQISSLQTVTSSQGGTIAQHTTDIATANANISTNATAITAANGNIASLTMRVGTAESSIGTNATAISNLTGRAATLETTVSSQGASIVTLQSATSTLTGDLAALTVQVSAGNPNLVKNGGFENELTDWFFGAYGWGWYATEGNGWGRFAGSTSAFSGQRRAIISPVFSVAAGQQFTAAADTHANWVGNCSVYLSIAWLNGAQGYLSETPGNPRIFPHTFSSDGSGRRALKVTGPAHPNAVYAAVYVVFDASGGGTFSEMNVRQLKAEKGAVATPYTQEASVTQGWTAITTATVNLASLTTRVATAESSVTTNATAISNLNGRTATLETNVAANGASISSLQTVTSTHTGQIAQVSSDLSTANANISQNATAISTLQGQQAALSSTVSSQGASITNLQTATSTLQGNVATLTTQVNAGNPNLLTNGSGEMGLTDWVSGYGSWAVNNSQNVWGQYFYVVNAGSAGEKYYHIRHTPTPFNAGYQATFTFGGDCAADGYATMYSEVRFLNSGGSVLATYNSNSKQAYFGFGDDAQNRVDLKCTTPPAPAGTASVQCTVSMYTANGVNLISGSFRQAKLEVGTVATPYSGEASVVQQFQTLSTLTTQYASLSSTVATQGVSISTQATAITTIQGNVTTLFGRLYFGVDVGGRLSSMTVNNNGIASSIIFNSDLVRFESPDPGTGALEWKDEAIQMRDGAGKLRIFMGYRA